MAANLQRLSPLARTGAQFGARAPYQGIRQRATLARPPLTRNMPTPQANPFLNSNRMPQARRLHLGNPAPLFQNPIQAPQAEIAALVAQATLTQETLPPLPIDPTKKQDPKPFIGLAALMQPTKPETNVIHRRELELQRAPTQQSTIHQEGAICKNMGQAPTPVDNVELVITLPKKPRSLPIRMAYGLGTALAFIAALPFRIAFFPVKKTYDLGVYLLTPKASRINRNDFISAPSDFPRDFTPAAIVQEMTPPQPDISDLDTRVNK